MKTVKEIRLENARLLVREAGGQKGMIEKTGRSQSQISQLMGDNAEKPIGDSIARSLEKACGKPRGWLDQDHAERNVADFEVRGPAASWSQFSEEEAVILIRKYLPRLSERNRIAIAQAALAGLE